MHEIRFEYDVGRFVKDHIYAELLSLAHDLGIELSLQERKRNFKVFTVFATARGEKERLETFMARYEAFVDQFDLDKRRAARAADDSPDIFAVAIVLILVLGVFILLLRCV